MSNGIPKNDIQFIFKDELNGAKIAWMKGTYAIKDEQLLRDLSEILIKSLTYGTRIYKVEPVRETEVFETVPYTRIEHELLSKYSSQYRFYFRVVHGDVFVKYHTIGSLNPKFEYSE